MAPIAVLQFIPLFLIPLVIYLSMYVVGVFPAYLNYIMFHLTLPSGAIWKPTYGDFLLIMGVLILFFELYKSTQTNTTSILDHIFSTFVLIAYLVIWLIYPFAGNSYFLILSLMSFLDVIAGFTITISTARRDFGFGDSK